MGENFMTAKIARPRCTGLYGVYEGREFHVALQGEKAILRSFLGEPEAHGFSSSKIASVQGICSVARIDLESLSFVRALCKWRGEPFVIVGVEGGLLSTFYIGERGEWMSSQPGIMRTGKLECYGRFDLVDVDEIIEFVDPLPL